MICAFVNVEGCRNRVVSGVEDEEANWTEGEGVPVSSSAQKRPQYPNSRALPRLQRLQRPMKRCLTSGEERWSWLDLEE